MKITKLTVAAAMFLLGMPAYAAKEFDCPPAPEVQGRRNETVISEDLVEKRRQARESDLARLRERCARATTTRRNRQRAGSNKSHADRKGTEKQLP
jgi:hypothetical protein